MRSTILLTLTVLIGCGGGGGTSNSPTPPNPAAAFTSDPTLLGAVSDAQGRGSVYLTETGAPGAQPVAQSFAVQPLAVAEPQLKAAFLTENTKTLTELQAEADAFDAACSVDNIEPACRLNITRFDILPKGNVLLESISKEQEYTYNGKMYRDKTVEFIEFDGDEAGAYYSCEVEESSVGSGQFQCIPGTLLSVAAGTSLTNLPTSGTASYAGFYFGEVDTIDSVIPATGTFDIIIALTPNALSSGTVAGVGTVSFSGNVVVDNVSGLIGSADLLVSYNDIPKDGFMFGWLHGNGGTLVSGVIGTESTSEAGGFGFDALIAGVSTDVIDVTAPPPP